ncbi:MAG TPA: phosphoglucomutase/phosphomannomutase family protein [Abditibacteriaceae bacterium]|jgi:alpha-D-glucose phosphate-specific phosphoglucomutase
MATSPIAFGTDGWRAVIADAYTFDNVRAIAGALAAHLKTTQKDKINNGVAIGYDTRFLSAEFARVAADTMAAQGVPVWISDRDASTPAISWAVKSGDLAGGVMITASHNPPKYNGFKFFIASGQSAGKESTGAVEALLGKKHKLAAVPAEVEEFNPIPNFLQQLRNVVDFDLLKKNRGRVVCDFVHGVGRGMLDTALRDCGWKVSTIRETPDPMFGGILPDPANPLCHNALQAAVLKGKADLGLANDPDADRFGVVDSKGVYLSPNQIIALVYVHLLTHRQMKGDIARTVATTHLLDLIAAKHGQKVKETPVGFKWLGAALDAGEAILGGEESGGMSIANHTLSKDGIVADLLAAEVWAVHKAPLSEVYAKLMKKYGAYYSTRIDVHLEAEAKDALMNGMKTNAPSTFGGSGVRDVVTLDGVKLNLEDGSWLLLRASGTEPLVRVYLEARTKARLKELEKAAAALSQQ